jgi:NADH-quinone oxidoreductase subunit E
MEEDIRSELEGIVEGYPEKRAAMLLCLHLICARKGYVSDDDCVYVARLLEVEPVEVREVTTFYTMFPDKPRGKYHIQVCKTLSCMLLGSGEVLSCLAEKWSLHPGGKTRDGKFSLELVECLASCGTAPALMINDELYENMTSEKLGSLLESFE